MILFNLIANYLQFLLWVAAHVKLYCSNLLSEGNKIVLKIYFILYYINVIKVLAARKSCVTVKQYIHDDMTSLRFVFRDFIDQYLKQITIFIWRSSK